MKTTDGYLVPDEHLEVIKDICKLKNGLEFNITLIHKNKNRNSYEIEGTYVNIDRLYHTEIEFEFIKKEIRNHRIDKILR